MNPILPTEETIEYEDRFYLNPQIGLDESNQFIENLRETQDNNIAQIQTQTQRLGTDVPSSLGGLTGPGSYFTSRYATPQNSSTLQNLRTAAQSTALNQVLANEQAMWKKRYDDAYRAYQKRVNQRETTPTTTNTNLPIDTNSDKKEKTNISQYTDGEYEKQKMYPVTDYVSDYQDANGQWWQVITPRGIDILASPANDLYKGNWYNEKVVTRNGTSYMYLDNIPNKDPAWYKVVKSAGPGTYSPYAGD